MKTLICIGMDVHKETISLSSFDRETNRIFAEVKIPTRLSEVMRYLDNRAAEFKGQEVTFKLGYESGCLGTWLAEDLISCGYDCVVMAPSTIAKSSVQEKKKNDSSDAIMIAKALAWNQYSAVHLRDQADQNLREVVHLRSSYVDDCKRAKQRLLSFLLRHNLRYDQSKSPWTIAHMKWLHELKMENPDDQYVLEEMITCVEKRMEDADRLTRKLESYSSRERYQEKAANLQAFKGVAKVTALTVLAETGDFSRFEKASQFAAYVGLIPSDYSSGGKTLHGGITKAGNKTVRTALIEAVQALVKGSGTSKKSKVLQQRQADLNPMVIAYADRGTERVRSKFYGYKRRGMKYNKAIAACAREFACFIWGMMTGHMETREMKMFSQTAGCDPVTGKVIKADFETVAA